jgi:quinol-cytochrome oxidoreductase complex cytochrome b subunit
MYPIPCNINMIFNIGFILLLCILGQIISGILLSVCYNVNKNSVAAFSIIVKIMREFKCLWLVRAFHIINVSLLFILVLVHLNRSILLMSIGYSSAIFVTGIIMLLIFIIVSFIGYVLPWGLMSYWGAVVITNLVKVLHYVYYWLLGTFSLSVITLTRLYLLHYLLTLYNLLLLLLHLYYLHYYGSDSLLSASKLKYMFYPFIVHKDLYSLSILWFYYNVSFLHVMLLLCHPDNAILVSVAFTPLHLQPEWYFLCYYMILKCIDSKYVGICNMIGSILFIVCLINMTLWLRYTSMLLCPSLSIILYCLIQSLLLSLGAQIPHITILNHADVLCCLFFCLVVVMLFRLYSIG